MSSWWVGTDRATFRKAQQTHEFKPFNTGTENCIVGVSGRSRAHYGESLFDKCVRVTGSKNGPRNRNRSPRDDSGKG